MDFASIQAQLANLTSQLSPYAERTTMQSVPTFGASYRQGFQANQCPQRDWSDHSNSMWWEAQQVQHEAYWQPYEEFYQWPYEPSQPPQQSAQFNSGTSMDNDTFNKLLTSLNQEVENRNKEMQNQAKKMGELEKHVGQIMEFMVQIQEQSELTNSNIVNSMGEVENDGIITLESDMEDEAVLEPSKHSPNMDELLLQEEEEEDDMGSLEELLPQAPQVLMPSNSGEVVLNPILSNPIPPNVPFPRRFMISNNEESEKDIVEALPKVQSDTQILGTPKQVPDYVEFLEENCTPRRRIQEKEVAGEYVEFIKENVFKTTKLKEVEFYDTGQVITIIVNLAKSNIPETFKEVVFVLEFLSDHTGKPPPPISISFSTNMLIMMIQAPTLEFKPLSDHFKYHLPFKDQCHTVAPNGA